MTARSLVVDAGFVSRTARETVWSTITRWPAILVWIAPPVLLLVLVILGATGGDTPQIGLILALVLYATLFPLVLLRQAHRALRAALPVGSTFTVDVHADGVRTETARGKADIAWSSFRAVHVGRGTVMLPLRGSSITSTLPRGLLDDTDIRVIREGVARAT